MIMRFRPANIRLINRRSKLLGLLLALSSGKESNDNDKNNPHCCAVLTRSLHIRPIHSSSLCGSGVGLLPRRAFVRSNGTNSPLTKLDECFGPVIGQVAFCIIWLNWVQRWARKLGLRSIFLGRKFQGKTGSLADASRYER
jgi:hypothetical protein